MGKPDFLSRLNQANGQLKMGKIGVAIAHRGDRLYLVATLPPKPGSQKIKPYQQRIALGYRLSYAGIDQAVKDAKSLSSALIEKRFSWNDYLEAPCSETVGDWIEQLRVKYLGDRREDGVELERIQATWESEYIKAFKKLDWDVPLTLEALEQVIRESDPNSRTRRRLALAFAKLADLAGLEHSLREKVGNYSPKRVNPRDVPSDLAIAQWHDKIPNLEWQSVYALMACYGLRNYEVFRLDLSDFPIIFVHKGKTEQERYVYPIYPEWVNEWLIDIKIPQCSGVNTDLGNRVTHAFKRYQIPFHPYDLRHAWARRSLEFGWDISLAANQMGHSVKVHTDIYHAWITKDVYQRTYERLINHPDRPKQPVLLMP